LQTDDDPITDPEIVSFLRKEYGADATADAFYNPGTAMMKGSLSLVSGKPSGNIAWHQVRFQLHQVDS
jgi:hypothetical protein